MNEKKLFLLDAMALIYRAYFALQRTPRITSQGRNTNAQFGFTTTLLDLLNREQPSHLAVVFEGGRSDTDVHRSNVFADYKANRQAAPEDIINALPDIQRIVEGFSLPCLSSPGYEADDVIGTVALEAASLGYTVYMVTPDKDYGQLVRDNVFMYKPGYQGKPFEILGPAEVCAKWSIKRVDQVIDLLGLMGDTSDNIPGIPGVGEKTAVKLLAEFDTLEGVLEGADSIKGAMGEKVRNGKESALMSKQLATIITDVPISFHDEEFRVKDLDREKLESIFNELEFKSLSRRVFGEAQAPKPAQAFDLFGNPTQGGNTLFFGTDDAASDDVDSVEASTIDTTAHQYFLYQTHAEIEGLIAQLQAQNKVAFDTETTHIDANYAELVGFSFCWKKGEAHYVAFPESREEVLVILKKFQPLFAKKEMTWVGQNLKYDLLVLRWYGTTIEGALWDTLLAHFLIEPDGKRNMDALSLKYLHYQPVSIESLIGKKGKEQKTMRDVPAEQVKDYAAEDADVTWQLQEVFRPMVEGSTAASLFRDVENKLMPVLVEMEYTGVGIDVPFLTAYSKELEQEIKKAEESVYRQAGQRFNLASPKQLGEILFDGLKIDGGGKKTKTGQYATGEEVLQKLRKKHPIIEDILSFRQLAKLKSTYVDALPQLIHPKTGRIHTSFNQTIAVTGRLSSNNPNLQNIPIKSEAGREIRKAFVAREGYTLLSADYSQIELRIIAALAGETAMIAAFADNKDIHTATAAGVYGVPESEVTSEQRRNAKAVNFGIIYGQTAFGLSESLGIARSEAKEIIDNYFRQYPFIQKYILSQIQFARAHQYVESMLGRRRWLPDILSANQTVRGFAERNSVNMPIQGTASDMIKLAMLAVDKELKAAKMNTKMILQVHDELIFDVPLAEAEQAKQLITDAMCHAMVLPNQVPIRAEAGMGSNWLEAH
ncbi:MAG: DNA polymerase I [Bacteroidetes bacterium]|nr:DNA polymerase I [Bacteroidota bacterium]